MSLCPLSYRWHTRCSAQSFRAYERLRACLFSLLRRGGHSERISGLRMCDEACFEASGLPMVVGRTLNVVSFLCFFYLFIRLLPPIIVDIETHHLCGIDHS